MPNDSPKKRHPTARHSHRGSLKGQTRRRVHQRPDGVEPKFSYGEKVRALIDGVWVEGTIAFTYRNPDYREFEYIVSKENWEQTPVILERFIQRLSV